MATEPATNGKGGSPTGSADTTGPPPKLPTTPVPSGGIRRTSWSTLLAPRLAGRTAGGLFLAASALSVPTAVLSDDTRGLLLLVSLGFAVGVGALLAPWDRWPPNATLTLVVPALALIVAGNALLLDPWVYGTYFVLLFMWVGLSHPPWTSTRLLAPAIAAFMAPALWVDFPADGFRSLWVVAPTWLLVGELMAWTAARIRRAEMADVRRAREMESLLAASVLLARETSPDGAANLVAGLATRLVSGEAGVVLLRDGRDLRVAGTHNWTLGISGVAAGNLDQPVRDALGHGRITSHAGDGPLATAAGGRPLVIIPLRTATEPLGVVAVAYPAGHSGRLDPFVADIAVTFATQAMLTFERLRSTRKLLDESRLDPLTGVGNRRVADEALARIRHGDAVVLIDLDRFKRINDTLGHAEGDKVLVALASFLNSYLRDADTFARFGGEEFLVILRGAGDQAGAAVERILAGWRATGPATTFSAGIAIHPEGGDPVATLAAADSAMYVAKRGGRDQVVVANDEQRAPAGAAD